MDPNKCAHCGKTFSSEEDLAKHLVEHSAHQMMVIYCDICCGVYPSRADLVKHLQDSHKLSLILAKEKAKLITKRLISEREFDLGHEFILPDPELTRMVDFGQSTPDSNSFDALLKYVNDDGSEAATFNYSLWESTEKLTTPPVQYVKVQDYSDISSEVKSKVENNDLPQSSDVSSSEQDSSFPVLPLSSDVSSSSDHRSEPLEKEEKVTIMMKLQTITRHYASGSVTSRKSEVIYTSVPVSSDEMRQHIAALEQKYQ